MMLWFGCYNEVMTSDRFLCLFGRAIPALSLLLVLVFRLIPRFFRQIRQISGARRSVGKGAGDRYRDKVADGLTVLSAMTSWALEGEPGDSGLHARPGLRGRTAQQLPGLPDDRAGRDASWVDAPAGGRGAGLCRPGRG